MKRAIIILSLFVYCTLPCLAQKSESTSWYVKDYSEKIAKQYLDDNYYLDQIEGIWQSTDGFKYVIEKNFENNQRKKNEYRMIVLESSMNGWSCGQIKGFISQGSMDGMYSMKYYTRYSDGTNTESQNVFLMLESKAILKFSRIDNGQEILLAKLYPKISSSETRSSQNMPNTDEHQWSGSGIVIGDKYIATNYHVVENAKNLDVCGINGDISKNYHAELVVSDKYNDLAILKVVDNKFEGFGTIKYGFKITTADVGTNVFVLGYPLTTTMGNEVKLTNGIISSKTGFQGDVSLYQISAPVQSGNSGGPVFDDNGNLIGIVCAKHTGAENVGYAIKLNYLQNLIESSNEIIQLKSNNTISSLSLSEKVKSITPFVMMIKANASASSSINSGNVYSSQQNGNNKSLAEDYLYQSQENYNNQDFTQAYSDITESVKLYPTPPSHYMRGFLACYYAKDYDIAIESLNYCIENNYRVSSCNSILSSCYYQLERYEDVIQICDKLLQIDRRDANALYLRGLSKSKTGDYEGCLADYQQAIKYEGVVKCDYGTIYNNIAYTYIKMGEINNAIEPIKEALKRNHIEAYIWDTDGELAYKLGDYQRCIVSMNNAITIARINNGNAINNEMANSYYYRGLANAKSGNMANAYSDLEKARDLGKDEAQTELLGIDPSVIDFSNTISYNRMVKQPTLGKKGDTDVEIKAIEMTNEYTAIYLSWTNTEYDNGYYAIDSNSYIRDKQTGNKYILITTENCEIAPNKTDLGKGETANFILYFQAIPLQTEKIDFCENEQSNWKFYNISLK